MADDEARAAGLIEVRPGYFRASWPMAAAAVIRELTACEFVTQADATARLTPADGRRLAAALASAQGNRGPAYLEHGNPPPVRTASRD